MSNQLVIREVTLSTTAAPGDVILPADARRKSFTLSSNSTFTSLSQSFGTALGQKFYTNWTFFGPVAAANPMIEPFRRFCDCDHAQITKGEIRAYADNGQTVTIYITEVIEVPD